MKKNKSKTLATALALALSLLSVSCVTIISAPVPGPTAPDYQCREVYDHWGNFLYYECGWYYYNEQAQLVSTELDMAAYTGDVERLKLQRLSEFYAQKFSLSLDKGAMLAKAIEDFKSLEDRTEKDLVDFSQRLYGLNAHDIVNAVSQAQSSNNEQLDRLIEQAAVRFDTNAQNMKSIVKELHKKALEDLGIEL